MLAAKNTTTTMTRCAAPKITKAAGKPTTTRGHNNASRALRSHQLTSPWSPIPEPDTEPAQETAPTTAPQSTPQKITESVDELIAQRGIEPPAV